jgi:hypothetical protein
MKKSIQFWGIGLMLIFISMQVIAQKSEQNIFNFDSQQNIEKNMPALLGNSNFGTEFWLTFHPAKTHEMSDSTVYIYVISDVAAKVYLEIEAINYYDELTVNPNEPSAFKLTHEVAQCYLRGDEPQEQKVFAGRAIHVYSDAPITVYGMLRTQVDAEGFLALPQNAYGTRYIASSWPDNTDDKTQFTSYVSIVGVYDETTVEFTLGGMEENYTPGSDQIAFGDRVKKKINKGDVWLIGPKGRFNDVSGSLINSDKPVSVISGNYATAIKEWMKGPRNYLIEHLMPMHTWGKKYHVAPIAGRDNASFVRIYSSERSSTYYRDGNEWAYIKYVGGLENGGWISKRAIDENSEEHTGAATISSDKRFQITQYNPSQGDDNQPYSAFMMNLVPVEQYYKQVTFCAPGDTNNPEAYFSRNYINLIYLSNENGLMPDDLEYGMPKDGTVNWTPFKSTVNFPGINFYDPEVTDGRMWKVVQFMLPDPKGIYSFRCNDPFMIYGYGVDGNTDSYGYPMGSKFLDISIPDRWAPSVEYTMDCTGFVSGLAKDEPYPQPDSLRSNFSSFKLLSEESYNYELSWNQDEFMEGSTSIIDWELQLVDAAKDAKAVLYMLDLAGNDTTVTIEYQPTKLTADSLEYIWQCVDIDNGVTNRKAKLINNSEKIVEVGSILLVSRDPARFYDYQGFTISEDLYNSKTPIASLAPGEEFEFDIEFDPNSVSEEIANGQTTFVDTIWVKAAWNYDSEAYCINRGFAVVRAEICSPVIEAGEVDFGTLYVGTDSEYINTVGFKNVGDADLVVTDYIPSTETDFRYEFDVPQTIEAGRMGYFKIFFTPNEAKEYSETVELISNSNVNDSRHDNIIEITGIGKNIDAPVLVSPDDNLTGVSVMPNFTWEGKQYINDYTIEVSINNTFDSPLINETVTTTEHTPNKELDYTESYYWRVTSNYFGAKAVSDIWRFTTEDDVSVEDIVSESATIRPNIASDIINIDCDSFIETVKIYNQIGEMIIITSNSEINISNLPVGKYFVMIETADGIEKGEFVKK